MNTPSPICRIPATTGRRLSWRGFTLIEMLITLCVFTIGLLPLMVLFHSSQITTAKAKNLLIAETIGRTTIDELRSLGIDGIEKLMASPLRGVDGQEYPLAHADLVCKGMLVPSDAKADLLPKDYGRFQTAVVLTPTPASTNPPDPDQRPVSYTAVVTVSWHEESQRTHEVKFGTIIRRWGNTS